MTQPNRPTPWPRTWPPFWRDVLHVAIAAGVGNVSGVAFRVAALRYRPFLFIYIAPDTLWLAQYVVALAVLPALVVALLSRAGRRAQVALPVASLLGYLAGTQVMHRLVPDLPKRDLALGSIYWVELQVACFAVVASVVIALVLIIVCRRVSARNLIPVCATTVFMIFFSRLWSEFGVPYVFKQLDMSRYVWLRVYSHYDLLVTGISEGGPIALTFAITAKLLLRAAEREASREKGS